MMWGLVLLRFKFLLFWRNWVGRSWNLRTSLRSNEKGFEFMDIESKYRVFNFHAKVLKPKMMTVEPFGHSCIAKTAAVRNHVAQEILSKYYRNHRTNMTL